MELETFELAGQPEPGHILVETVCTLISTGTELANWTGITTQRKPLGDDWTAQPYRPGYSYVGVVHAVGDGVRGLALGDRICGSGPHASAATLREDTVALVPSAVSDVQAAFATLLVITMNAVRLAKIELGDRVASVGLGLIGNLALQQARLCGEMPAVGTDLTPKRRGYGEKVGLITLDPAVGNAAGQIDALTDGQRFDVVFESTGSSSGLKPALSLAGRHARVVALGSTRGVVEGFDIYGDVHVPGVTIIGAHMMTAPDLPNFANRWTAMANRKLALRLLAERRLDVDSLVSHQEPPEKAFDLFALLADHREQAMGVILDWRR